MDLLTNRMLRVTDFRALDLRKPTVKLLFENGFLLTSNENIMIKVAAGLASIANGPACKFSISPDETSDTALLWKGAVWTVN
jgi:hypothetical protein